MKRLLKYSNAMRAERQERHREWKRLNTAAIEQSGLTFRSTNNGETLVLRGNLEADFYPSTGRWRSGGKTYSGGAKRFINWYVTGLQRGRMTSTPEGE